jgi:hypothetical protein
MVFNSVGKKKKWKIKKSIFENVFCSEEDECTIKEENEYITNWGLD